MNLVIVEKRAKLKSQIKRTRMIILVCVLCVFCMSIYGWNLWLTSRVKALEIRIECYENGDYLSADKKIANYMMGWK